MLAGEDHLPAPGSAFALSRRGYDSGQVDDYLRHLDAQLRMLAADRDAAVEQNAQLARQVNVAWAEADQLKVQIRRLSAAPESVEGMSERLQTMLQLAQDEVAERRRRVELDVQEMITKAEAAAVEPARRNEEERRRLEQQRLEIERECSAMLAQARAEAERTRSEAASEARRVRSEAIEETTRQRAESTAAAELLRSTSEDEREAENAKSAAARTQVEEDFKIAMATRRAELMTSMERNRVNSQADAKARLEDAQLRATRLLDEATGQAQQLRTDAENHARSSIEAAARRVHELETLRDRLRRQLADLRGILDHAIGGLATPEPPVAADTPVDGADARGAAGGSPCIGTPPGVQDGPVAPVAAARSVAALPVAGNGRPAVPGNGDPAATPTTRAGTSIPVQPPAVSPQESPGPNEAAAGEATEPADAPPRPSPRPRPSPVRRRPTPAGQRS